MAKTMVSLRLDDNVVQLLDKHAKAEDRSRSNLLERVIKEFFHYTHGVDNTVDPPCGFCGTTKDKRDEMQVGDRKKWICAPCLVILKEDADKPPVDQDAPCANCGTTTVQRDQVDGEMVCVECDARGVEESVALARKDAQEKADVLQEKAETAQWPEAPGPEGGTEPDPETENVPKEPGIPGTQAPGDDASGPGIEPKPESSPEEPEQLTECDMCSLQAVTFPMGGMNLCVDCGGE